MSRIRVLPDHLVNQIAAGEVVERPVSVVKELLENSLDAGAKSIAIDIESGGRRRIKVADDGEGLDSDDAVLAFERHATSKLTEGSDLGKISTLGFRGEALPAIAAVSRLTLRSSRDGASGVLVEVEGGRIKRVEQTGHPRGTTLEVRDLFFNTPARGKFLRSPPTELAHISELVSSYAVTIPWVRVTLTHDRRQLMEAVPVAEETQRVSQLFGSLWADAIPVKARAGPVSIRGLIAPPARTAATRRMQHLYVNGRLVKDRLVAHAVAAATEDFLPKGRHAALFLFVSCPAAEVDVNVHPTKAEVRFADTRRVHDLVKDGIGRALRSAMPITPMRSPYVESSREAEAPPAWRDTAGRGRQEIHEAALGYLEGAGSPGPYEARTHHVAPSAGAVHQREVVGAGPVALAHYRESYILASDESGLLILDQHAAHERILYERLLEGAGSSTEFPRQALMFPVTITPPRALAHRLQKVAEELNELGFLSEPFGEGTLVVRDVPGVLDPGDPTDLVSDLLEQMIDEDASEASLPRKNRLLAAVACHAAIKVRMPLTHEKMNYLIKELFRTASPLKCPHGRPAMLRFSHESIQRGFDRR